MATPEASPFVPFTAKDEKEQVAPILIGHLISFALFGVGVLQFYYVLRQLDILRLESGGLKGVNLFQASMALILFISDCADTLMKGIFVTQYVRQSIVGGLPALEFMPKTAFAICFLDGWIASLTHVIYTARLLRVNSHNGNWIWGVAALAMSISLLQFVASIVTGVRSWDPVSDWKNSVAVTVRLWLAGAGVCDILLCVVFVFSIAQHRTDFSGTNYVITRWIAFTLETGIFTSALQITDLILFLTYPDRTYHLACAICLGKIYFISVIIMLSSIYSTKLRGMQGSGGMESENDGGEITMGRSSIGVAIDESKSVDVDTGEGAGGGTTKKRRNDASRHITDIETRQDEETSMELTPVSQPHRIQVQGLQHRSHVSSATHSPSSSSSTEDQKKEGPGFQYSTYAGNEVTHLGSARDRRDLFR